MTRGSSTPATVARPRPRGTAPSARFVRVGAGRAGFGDLYHFILMMRWDVFLLAVIASQLVINLLFAVLFWLQPNNITNATSFLDDFYFSVQTWATIGYGGMTPKTTYANLIVVVESIAGILSTAVTTGLVFAKFARPTARILFSEKAVIATRDGKRVLMFRVANERGNDIVEASARVTLLRDEVTREGERMRRLYDLPLVRNNQPLFVITWTLMHEIDEQSPLFGKTAEEIEASGWMITVNVTGHDGTLSQTIHGTHFYLATSIDVDSRFVDVISPLPDGRTQIDLRRFHDTVKQ